MLKVMFGKVEPKIGDKVYHADDWKELVKWEDACEPGEVIVLNKCSRELELEWIVVKWDEKHIEEYKEDDLLIIG